MSKKPLVSVLMTAYNREQYIGKSIESVLSSSFKDFELLIVDDCSVDSTVHIAKQYEAKDSRIKVFINDQNLGDYPNRNRAASFATGKYIKYLDSDDIIYPFSLNIMVHAMETFPEAGLGLCATQGKTPFPELLTPRQAYREHFLGLKHFDRAPASAIIKRESFETVGGFTGARMIGDMELWFNLARQFPVVKFQKDLTWNREHEGQESQSGYARHYKELVAGVIDKAINHPACPLTAEDKSQVRKFESRQNFKNMIFGNKAVSFIMKKVLQ